MPPRAVKTKCSTIALKKRPLAETIRERKGEEAREDEIVEHKDAKNEEYEKRLLDSKESEEKKKHIKTDYNKFNQIKWLDLEDDYPNSEAEDDSMINVGKEDHQEGMGFQEEENDEERIGEDEMMEGEEEEDHMEEYGGNEHNDEVDGDEEEHHVVKERRKRKEFEIFVGGLDRDAIEEDLVEVFSRVGEIAEVRLMKNPVTQKNKGFAFIRFATTQQAKRAINELKHPIINGKQCGVAPSQDSDTLFVGNISKTWTKEVFKEKLAQYGIDNFEDLTLVEDIKNVGMNRGFAFLDFSSRTDASDACKHLQRMEVVFGTNRIAKVSFADTFIEPNDVIMAQVKKVFIDGLHVAWDEDNVRQHFGKFGKIEMVELARNMPAAKRIDFGFVTFDTHDAAVACVEGINNAELCDGDNKVKVRARLTRPRQRGKPGNHARGGYLYGRGSGRGARASRSSGMHVMNSWRFTGHDGEDRKYCGGFKQPLSPRRRYTSINQAYDGVKSRWRMPSLERPFDRRSPGPSYRKGISKREHIHPDEHLARPPDFGDRAPADRYLSYRDAYPSHEPRYMDGPSQSSSRGAAHQTRALYAKESYGICMEPSSSYHDSHSHDYGSGSKRHHSSVEEFHSYHPESIQRQPRARIDFREVNDDMAYDVSAYGSESARRGRGSHLEYKVARSSAGHSREYNARTSSIGYTQDEMTRGDAGRSYSSYERHYISRDYTSSRRYGGEASYSSVYSSRRMNDGYSNNRGSQAYY